ncbi:MAG: LysM peptidoglycan-binding domain-containing protein [Methylacidiphilales bacterium]|nr:LysM peptidoglycan-binding domain-containing protein [Candidatus Methylacidiphilales bacterium]
MDRVAFSSSPVLIVIFCCCLAPLPAYAQDQGPAAQQDEEAARQKILKAADQIDMIETNSEATKSSVDAMQADLTKLQDENAALKQQLADLQAAFNKSEADRAKERQALLDEVADLVKSGKTSAVKKKPAAETDATANTSPQPATPGQDSTLAPPPDAGSASSTSAPDTNTTPKPQKGYYHVVQSGETLTMICSAYRQNGIKVTVVQICKANGLTDKSVLRVGQKLFIPKPGT